MEFGPEHVHFRTGPPTIVRKHMSSGMSTESLGVIGCIFAENGPLGGGIFRILTFSNRQPISYSKAHALSYTQSKVRSQPKSLWWFGVDFWHLRVLFRRRPPSFSERTCAQVWAQKVWELLDVYSRRMGPYNMALNQVSVVPAGVLRVIKDGFWASMRAFS